MQKAYPKGTRVRIIEEGFLLVNKGTPVTRAMIWEIMDSGPYGNGKSHQYEIKGVSEDNKGEIMDHIVHGELEKVEM